MSDTMVKALLRLLGTCVRAFVGFVLVYLIQDNPIWLGLTFGFFVTLTSFIALQTKPYNYCAIVAGFTAVVIISSKVLGNVQAIAWFRTLEVIFGIMVYAFINIMVEILIHGKAPFFDYKIKSKLISTYHQIHLSKETIINALTISIPTTLTFISWLIWKYPYGFWTTVTLLVIMEDTLSATRDKSMARFLGQTLAAVCGLLVAFYANGDVLLTGIALAIGFFISGCIIGSNSKIASMGNHAGSAIAIMLLVGLKEGATDVVTGRFFNVLAGILIANTVMWLHHRLFER
jgi:uncharacterized membrane protein YccC